MRLARRDLLLLGSAGSFSILPARAQRRESKPRVGYITGGTSTDENFSFFMEGMRRVGLVENRDWELLFRYADFDYTRFPAFAEELLAAKTDVLVTGGPATRVARMAAKSVPVVFGYSGDPVAAGIVESLARPGTNATGMSAMALELAGKRLSLLHEVVPHIRRVAVLSNPNHGGEQREWQATEESAPKLGLSLNYYRIPNASSIPEALESARRDGCEGLLTFPEAVSLYNRKTISDFAIRHGMPSVFGWKVYCQAGGLLSHGPDLRAFYGRLAVFVDRILRGTRPNDIPVELPVLLETVVNAATARAIQVDVPKLVMARADEVIG